MRRGVAAVLATLLASCSGGAGDAPSAAFCERLRDVVGSLEAVADRPSIDTEEAVADGYRHLSARADEEGFGADAVDRSRAAWAAYATGPARAPRAIAIGAVDESVAAETNDALARQHRDAREAAVAAAVEPLASLVSDC